MQRRAPIPVTIQLIDQTTVCVASQVNVILNVAITMRYLALVMVRVHPLLSAHVNVHLQRSQSGVGAILWVIVKPIVVPMVDVN